MQPELLPEHLGILTFGVPTVAAINGHITAGGAMLGLAFDKRLMPADSPGSKSPREAKGEPWNSETKEV